MADVLRTKDQFKLTFTLQNIENAEEIVNRDISFDVATPISDAATQKARFRAFRTAYMTDFANSTYDDESSGESIQYPCGSLVQPTNFRDDVTTDPEDQPNLYKCTDITGVYITTVERYFDNNE